jgi:ferritin-like metal-binding protein YciE
MPEPSVAQIKLVQYLNEAYGTEKRLETALTAHITMATRATYRKRLQQHLSETKRHGRDVSKRIKQLGGSIDGVQAPGPEIVGEAAQSLVAAGQRAVALAQGPLHALRGTGEAEKQLKNAKTEYASEAEEIATYTAIEALADAVGDRDTKRLARSIRREEERMRSYLEKEIPRMTSAVAKDEIPASERGGRQRSTRRANGRSSSARGTSTRSSGRSSSSRSGGRASSAGSRSSGSARGRSGGSSRSASGSSSRGGTRAASSRSGGSSSRSGGSSRSSGSSSRRSASSRGGSSSSS